VNTVRERQEKAGTRTKKFSWTGDDNMANKTRMKMSGLCNRLVPEEPRMTE
jgi:hypothetical protein